MEFSILSFHRNVVYISLDFSFFFFFRFEKWIAIGDPRIASHFRGYATVIGVWTEEHSLPD